MRKTADCVIVGGGVIGCALAYYLAREGITDCVVLESGYLASGATGRCGGGIRQQWSTEENARLAIESVRAFGNLSRELDADIDFLQGGYLVLAYTDEDVRQFERNVSLQRSLGLSVEVLSPEDIRRKIAPMLNTDGVRLATHCATDGSANPFLTTKAYADAARRLGAAVELYTPVTRVLADRGSLRWLAILSPTITAMTMSMIGVAPTYIVLVILLMTTGLSSAFWHVPMPVMIARFVMGESRQPPNV